VVRTYISFPAGVSDIKLLPFSIFTLAGAIPWNFALAYAGYQLGANWEHVGKVLSPFTIPIAIVVLALIVAAWYFGKKIEATEDEFLEKAVEHTPKRD
jgi:membrane protein DedA with SNARE-associated domain